jgi:hypothetical protein
MFLNPRCRRRSNQADLRPSGKVSCGRGRQASSLRAFVAPKSYSPTASQAETLLLGQIRGSGSRLALTAAAECYDQATVPREPACPDRQHPCNLSPPTSEGAPQWKAVGLELAHRCTFCGGPSEATLAPLSPHLLVRRSDPQCPVNVDPSPPLRATSGPCWTIWRKIDA